MGSVGFHAVPLPFPKKACLPNAQARQRAQNEERSLETSGRKFPIYRDPYKEVCSQKVPH